LWFECEGAGDFALQNKQAASYARWAAIAASAIALVVVGVYSRRAIRESAARRSDPHSVPSTVQQQSDQMTFSKVEGDRTIFTVRASHATEYKDQNRYLLEDVWVTIYGRDGNRNDNIHTRECGYQPKTGAVRCQGDVRIDIAGTSPSAGDSDQTIQVTTRDLTFNRETGDASTPEPVAFRFPQGQGHAVGVSYSTQNSLIVLQREVHLDLAPSDRSNGLPVSVTGGSLEVRRNERKVVLSAPADVRQGSRELTADKITIDLDPDFRAQHVTATGNPLVRSTQGGKVSISGNQFEAFLNSQGWIESIVADGNVQGARESAGGTDHFSSGRLEIAMAPQNVIRMMTTSGGTELDSLQDGQSRSLKTASLRVLFASGKQPSAGGQAPQPRARSAETLAPATIEMKSGNELTALRAKKFVTEFDAKGHLAKLLGHSGAEIKRTISSGAPQVSTANELVATFGASGDWETLDEAGNVHFQQADHQATAERAKMVSKTGDLTLDGSPVLFDSTSRTTARSVAINQKSGEIQATGGVASTYFSSEGNASVNLGSGPAHISAATLTASNASGHALYSGHARIWQGESVLDANQIEVWRDEKKLLASGNVIAIFPQASGQLPALPGGRPKPPPQSSARPQSGKAPESAPATAAVRNVWQIRAPVLTYWSDSGKAHLEGGVAATSQQGSLQSPVLDVFLAQAPMPSPDAEARHGGSGKPPAAAAGARQLDRALATGGVVVQQGDRRGTAEQAEYTTSDGKFVLSGGKPTITDASSDTTTGHSLTFFVSNDTILIDSEKASRTLTRHRVE
jgi:lipopolysaccharide export system protein LptA